MSFPPPPPPMPPQPSNTSFNARLILLATCLALVLALQLPLIQRTFQTALTPHFTTSSTLGWQRDPHHPRHRVFTALLSYLDYKPTAISALHKKRQGFKRLTPWHKKLLSPVNYTAKLKHAADCITTNDLLAQAILTHSLEHYNITFSELLAFRTQFAPTLDHTSVVQSLKHFIRDWSTAGLHEREPTFPPILNTLGDDLTGQKILVPGAGLGRLAYELAARGADVAANEYSYIQLAAFRWLLHTPQEVDAHTFHPAVNWWSHQARTSSLLRGETFPDIVPTASVTSRIRVVEGDFVSEFEAEKETYDVVVTLFFIDTAKNIIEYIDAIHRVLKKGGKWVNLGPLLYGTKPWVELSLEEVLAVVEETGFKLEGLGEGWGVETFEDGERWSGKVRGKLAGYSSDRESLARNAYQAQFWVATKE